MKHYLFVNKSGKKFKTTETGKRATLAHPQLSKTCKLLGECTDKGELISQDKRKVSESQVDSIREIMAKNQQKFEEPKRKSNVKEK